MAALDAHEADLALQRQRLNTAAAHEARLQQELGALEAQVIPLL